MNRPKRLVRGRVYLAKRGKYFEYAIFIGYPYGFDPTFKFISDSYQLTYWSPHIWEFEPQVLDLYEFEKWKLDS